MIAKTTVTNRLDVKDLTWSAERSAEDVKAA